jgi:phospholipase/carboxylesterase
MPHSQIGVRPVPEVNEALFARCFSLPDVRNEATVISIPGARALWLDEELLLAHPEAIARGREFAHIHPDGSLHASLSPDRAREAVEAGWAEPHPIAEYMGLDGLVMLYTPLDMAELDVIFELVLDSYNYVTGREMTMSEVLKLDK